MNGSALTLLMLACFALTSCAGPADPFGPINVMAEMSRIEVDSDKRGPAATIKTLPPNEQVKISFSPSTQIYHRDINWQVLVSDQNRLPSIDDISFYYQGSDVTEKVNQLASWKQIEFQKSIEIRLDGLSLPAWEKHEIQVRYTPSQTEDVKTYAASFPEAKCSFDQKKKIKNLSHFSRHEHLIKMIELVAKQEQSNPSLLAAIVAHESNFDPQALSWSKSIGLTQIPSTAEPFILSQKDQRNWPSYPGAEEMSAIRLKFSILFGQMNEKNDWRLDKEKSLRGGLVYFKHLLSHWQSADAQKIINQAYKNKIDNQTLTEIVLASYHTNAFKVERAIGNKGQNWRSAASLKSADNYIRKVNSYCADLAREI